MPFVRSLCDPMYEQHNLGDSERRRYYSHTITLTETLISELDDDLEAARLHDPALDDFMNSLNATLDEGFLDTEPLLSLPADISGAEYSTEDVTASTPTVESKASKASPISEEQAQLAMKQKIEANSCCEICGYRPKGDPKWFSGSMAKHRKLQHSREPPKLFACPFPSCSSQYKNRPDNLRQHQIEKGHFVGDEPSSGRRPSKRKKLA